MHIPFAPINMFKSCLHYMGIPTLCEVKTMWDYRVNKVLSLICKAKLFLLFFVYISEINFRIVGNLTHLTMEYFEIIRNIWLMT